MYSSSPLTSPAGRDGRKVISASPGSGWANAIDLDEDSDDRLSPYFPQSTQLSQRKASAPAGPTQPTQIVHNRTLGSSKMRLSQNGTQPTQIVNRTTLNGSKVRDPKSDSIAPSSPVTVEVPRSSPFKSSPPKTKGPSRNPIFASIAPAGTTFRPPQKMVQKPTLTSTDKNGNKTNGVKSGPGHRHARHPSSSSGDELHQSPTFNFAASDSSGDERRVRATIKPTFFQRNPPPAAKADPGSAKRMAEFEEKFSGLAQLNAKKLQKRVGTQYDLLLCAKVLQSKKGDFMVAEKFLRDRTPSKKTEASLSNSPKRSSASRQASPSPAPKRRRLVRGAELKNRTVPAPVVSLLDSDSEEVSDDKDDGDNFASDSEAASETEGDGSDAETAPTKKPQAATDRQIPTAINRTAQILRYLETCTVEGLAANAKVTKEAAVSIIRKRPIRTTSQLKVIHIFKTVRSTRRKVDLGEDVYAELNQYFKRLEAIDHIVHQCETQGRTIRAKIDQWKMDHLGGLKDDKAGTTTCVLPFPKEPRHMKDDCKMKPYQLYGMNWLYQLYKRGYGCVLADDMGLGKTCQTIAFLALLVDVYKSGQIKDKPWPNLVVVPPSVLANWEQEFEKFAPDLSVIKYSGSASQRARIGEELRASPEDYHVILTSYTQMAGIKDAKLMTKIGVNAALFDEAHSKLKNPTTKTYKELIRIEAQWKLLITGTPIQNNLMELMYLLNFLSPRLFNRDRELVQELFELKTSLKEVSEGAALHSDRIQRARGILEPFILLRKKEAVLQLPPKTRKVVYCDMTEDQKNLYQELVTRFRKSKKEEKTQPLPAKARPSGRKNDENNPWMQLRKAASHVQLFRRFFDNQRCEAMAKTLMKKVSQKELRQPSLHYLTEELRAMSDFELHVWCKDYPCIRSFDCPDGAWLDSGKVEKLVELLEEYRKNGDRVLIFSRFKSVVQLLGECMVAAGINCRVLHGATQVDGRQDIVDEFNNDTSIQAFILSTAAGGNGLNLTSANKVIIFDQSDNPQNDVQAENRVHRFGQAKEVEIVRLLTRNTIDELIYKACQKKLELAGQITGFSEKLDEENDGENTEEMDMNMVAEVTKKILEGEGGGSDD